MARRKKPNDRYTFTYWYEDGGRGTSPAVGTESLDETIDRIKNEVALLPEPERSEYYKRFKDELEHTGQVEFTQEEIMEESGVDWDDIDEARLMDDSRLRIHRERAEPTPSYDPKDIETINRHRRLMGGDLIDTEAGWTPKEIADMAENIRTKGRTHNPHMPTKANRAFWRGPKKIKGIDRWLRGKERAANRWGRGDPKYDAYGGWVDTADDQLYLSVVASNRQGFSGTYSSKDRKGHWKTVEVASLDQAVPELEDHYQEESGNLHIYRDVPVGKLDDLFAAHGGAREAEYPDQRDSLTGPPVLVAFSNPELKRKLMR